MSLVRGEAEAIFAARLDGWRNRPSQGDLLPSAFGQLC